MVQIKLAVVFILAVAAVAPVVALPIPVDQPSSGSKKGQKRKKNPLKSKPPPPEPGPLPPLPPFPDLHKLGGLGKKAELANPIVYRTGELPAPPPKTGMMNPSGPSVLPDHLKGKPLPPLPVREPNKHASSSNPPIPKEDFNKPNEHIDQATLDLQAARRNNLFRNAHHIPLRLNSDPQPEKNEHGNEGQQPKPPSLHIKSSFRKDLQQSTRNKIRKFTNFFKKS